jgi:hypothetical protein
MRGVPTLLFGLTFFLARVHCLPAPIQEVPESATTPTLEKQAKPKKRPSKTKAADSELRTKSETKASATRPLQGPARSAETRSSSSRRDVTGTPDRSTFGITEVKATETPDPEAETNLTLRINIRKQPNATIDHTKVKIEVFFYEMVDDKDIELTDADVNYEWVTPTHDWADTNPEILSVNYMRPKMEPVSSDAEVSEPTATIKPGQRNRIRRTDSMAGGGKRKYLGYRILVYYNGKLQAVKAEPARLLQLFPPSESTPSP